MRQKHGDIDMGITGRIFGFIADRIGMLDYSQEDDLVNQEGSIGYLPNSLKT